MQIKTKKNYIFIDMKNEILEEINRMKVLGGILNEATGPTSIIASLIAKITRTSLDDSILKAFEVLEQRGVISIDKAAKTLTKIDWQRLTDDELKLLFRAKPMRDALEEVANRVGINITNPASKASFKGNFKRIVKGYDDAAGSVISGGRTSTGGGTTGTIPGPSNNNPHIGGDDFGNVEDLFKNTYKTSPAFQVFYHMVENISSTVKLSSKDREKILLSWKQYGNHTPIQLEAEARKLLKTRQIEQYGWIKKLIAKGMEDPSKTIKIGGKTVLALSLWVPLAYAAAILGLFGVAQATVLKNWLNKNTNDSDVKDALLNSTENSKTRGIGDIPQN